MIYDECLLLLGGYKFPTPPQLFWDQRYNLPTRTLPLNSYGRIIKVFMGYTVPSPTLAKLGLTVNAAISPGSWDSSTTSSVPMVSLFHIHGSRHRRRHLLHKYRWCLFESAQSWYLMFLPNWKRLGKNKWQMEKKRNISWGKTNA